jgi:hypothetical protein
MSLILSSSRHSMSEGYRQSHLFLFLKNYTLTPPIYSVASFLGWCGDAIGLHCLAFLNHTIPPSESDSQRNNHRFCESILFSFPPRIILWFHMDGKTLSIFSYHHPFFKKTSCHPYHFSIHDFYLNFLHNILQTCGFGGGVFYTT